MAIDDVHFEDTQAAKVERLASLNLDVFIDDLADVFEQPHFPRDVRSILFDSSGSARPGPYKSIASWDEIRREVFAPMSEAGISAQEAMAVGSRLSGERMLAARPARPGGNNRVFCLDLADGTRLALKYYPSQGIDGRDRLGQEYEALSFLARHGVTSTPRPIACDTAGGCALYRMVRW